jgi:serine/threonine-protein kinase HipA
MEHVEKIMVSIQLNEEEIPVGELVSEGKNIYFKYNADFVKRGLEISPIKLKLNNLINAADPIPFEGLYGVFADSLPDGWGKLLLDRALTSRGVIVDAITVLDRLAYVGSSGMGALTYKPELEQEELEVFEVELDKIAKATNQIISGTATDVLDDLFKLGGSSGGARPKILIGYNPKTQDILGSNKTLPADYEHWLIKFPSSFDRPDIANIEFAYYKMALDAGVEMSESKLFQGLSGQSYFGTKRFDRIGNKRLHLHSAAGIMHDNFRLSNMDYGDLMDCAFQLERDVRAYEKILRLAAFNVFAHNRDDHSKNFAFLMDADGTWKVAPAYDLTFSTSGHGMHSTSVARESKNPTSKHLMELGKYFDIKDANKIIEEVQAVVFNWEIYAKQCDLIIESKNQIKKTINSIKS